MPEKEMPNEGMEGKSGEGKETSDNPGLTKYLRRNDYLRSIGFILDPFALVEAEQEYAFGDEMRLNGHVKSSDVFLEAPPSELFSPLAYYVDPRERWQRPIALEQTLKEGHVLVYGERGMGKTTLRLAAEASVRGEARRTLFVTYRLGPDADRLATLAHHFELLLGALTIDLFIQIIEKFDVVGPLPDAEKTKRLAQLIAANSPQLSTVIDKLRDSNTAEPSRIWGYAKEWRSYDRPVVRPVNRSVALTTWLDELAAEVAAVAWPTAGPVQHPPGEQWRQAVATAHLWEFPVIFVAADGIDTRERDRERMLAMMRPLLAAAASLAMDKVYLKCFLPAELQKPIAVDLADGGAAFTVIRLRWSEKHLRELLGERFRVAGSRRSGFNNLVEPALRDDFDGQLLRQAQGSPRRLLQLASRLIATHSSGSHDPNAPTVPRITAAEWRQTVVEAEEVAELEGDRPRRARRA